MKQLLAAVALVGMVGSAEAATLTWTDNSRDEPNNSQEQGFNVYRKTEACAAVTSNFGLQAVVGADVTTYVDPSNAEGKTYCYRVTAFNSTAGESAPSNTAEITIPFTVPRSPSGLTVRP